MPETVAYRLTLAPEFECFRPELEYACAFLDGCHFVSRSEVARVTVHYGHKPPPGALHVPPVLFPDGVRLDAQGIHPERSRLEHLGSRIREGRLFPPDDGPFVENGRFTYDALGLIFLMLSRLEERNPPEVDRYQRFPIGRALAFRQGRYAEPLADRAARDLAATLTGQGAPANRTHYDVCLTHDVDRLRGYHRPLEPLRWAAGDLLKRGNPGRAWHRLSAAYLSGDPWQSFRGLMQGAEGIGKPARFFFMGPSAHPMDSPYALTMKALLKKVTDEVLQRGHIVGFHPGFESASNALEWRRQRSGLESIIGCPVGQGRQHVLCYDAAATPDIWDEAGMELDCTLAFPEASGFRSGTCRLHHAYSLRRRLTLNLLQASTSIMDFSFFGGKYRDLSLVDALKDCVGIVETCRRFGGTVVILFHPGQKGSLTQAFYAQLLDVVQ